MMKRILAFTLVLILVIPSRIILGATDEGYGEAETALGQFVDSFETSNNVSVAVDVIRNSTLEVMELNYTVGADPMYENYSTFTKVGADSRLTVTNDTIITNPDFRRGTEEGYYLDMGVGNIGVFSYDFDFNVSDVEAGDASSRDMGSIFMVNNWIGDQQDQPVGTYDYLSVNIRNTLATDDQYNLRLVGGQNGAIVTDQISALQAVSGTIFYGTVWRDGSGDCNFTVFSDSARTTQVLSLAESDGGQSDPFQYLYGWFAIDATGDPDDWFVGSVSNLWGGGFGGGYVSDGYFSTVDYLADPLANGSALVAMVNTSIPANTDIQLQFSNDTVTWTDNEGVPGDSMVLLGGFESIDLRDLNYSTGFYSRFNLSTTDGTITPRVYQNRLITMIGAGGTTINQTVEYLNGTWIYYNLTAIANITGVHDDGFLNSTYFIDGDTWNCSEVVGAPGYEVKFNVTGIDENAVSLWLVTYIYYDGSSSHEIHVQAWNFSSGAYVELGEVDDDIGFEWHNYTVYEMRIPNDFVNSTGAFIGRYYHTDPGNINDDIMIDRINLLAFVPTGLAIAGAGAGANWGLLWFLLILICVPIALILLKGSRR